LFGFTGLGKISKSNFHRIFENPMNKNRFLFAGILALMILVISACDHKDEMPQASGPTLDESTASISGDGDQSGQHSLEQISSLILHGELPPSMLERLEGVIESNPRGAAEWAISLPPGSNRDLCLELVFGKWASINDSAAMEFVRSGLHGMDRTVAAASIADVLAVQSFRSVPAAVSLVSDVIPRGVVVRAAVISAFPQGAEEVGAWVLSLDSVTERQAGLLALTEVWSRQDPKACAGWVESVLKDDDKSAVVSELLAGWGRLSPGEAAQWLDQRKSVVDFEEASTALVDSWTLVAPNDAANWAGKVSSPELRTDLVETVVSTWVLNEAGGAIDWASALKDEDLRRSMLESAFLNLAFESPEALNDWIKKNPKHPAIHDAIEFQSQAALDESEM